MKNARRWIGGAALFQAMVLIACADDAVVIPKSVAVPQAPARLLPIQAPAGTEVTPAFSGANVVPIDTSDPEQVAEQSMAVAQTHRREPTLAEAMADEKRADDSHWMMRGYEEQLIRNGLEKRKPPANPYDLTSAPTGDRSRLDPLTPDPETETAPATPPPADALTAPTDPAPTAISFAPLAMKPLLPPLTDAPSPREASGYFSAARDRTSFNADNDPLFPTNSDGSTLLDVPGLTAAQDGKSHIASLSLNDSLPDENVSDSRRLRPDANEFIAPTAPLSDTEAFFKKQNETLHAPNAPTLRLVTVPAASPAVVNVPYTPPKPPVVLPSAGIRNRVADPFDILNR